MVRPVIDKTYPLEEIIDAHRYVLRNAIKKATWTFR